MAELVADSQDGIAVNAHSTNNHSLFSRSETSNGVIGHSNGDPGGGNAGVFGEHLNNGTGVTGKSQGGFGVAGLSQGNSGVFADSENGFGVQAHSVNSHGLVSRSETSNGVVGHSNGNPAGGNAGVFGEHLNHGTGVTGKSDGGFGVAGLSHSSNGVLAQSDTGIGLVAKGGRLAALFEGDVEVAGFFKGNVGVTGNLTVNGDVLLTGADLAEQFSVVGDLAAEPGCVVVLAGDDCVRVSDEAYDRRVAGIVSGAGNYVPALILDRRDDAGRRPLALTGKVWCKVDADCGPVEVGDLLTTSPTPGHAMSATDAGRAFGAVVGKALGSLRSGRGLVPVLVSLR
jgi:hypothetical protein